MSQATDVIVENYGSIRIIQPMTEKAWRWVDANVEYQGWQLIGAGVAVDPRMVDDLAEGMREADLAVCA